MPHPGQVCAVDVTVGVIGGRWKVLILQALFDAPHRFSQLHRGVKGITEKVLTQQLRELEVLNSRPAKVEYSLTPHGRTLWPVLQAMHSWGEKQIPQNEESAKPPKKATKKS